ncbi:MAG: right-handed parallel beta-helix repeat-containing protein, partial [Flavobacterium sp.]
MKSVLFIISLLLSIITSAKNYYFSTSLGDDSRTSLQAQNPNTPWRTLSKLNEFFPNILPGDSLLFKSGESFEGFIHISKSGTKSLPIVFTSYGLGTKPVINGFKNISSWISLGNGIYQSNVDVKSSVQNLLLINGTQYPKGRYPNTGYLSYESFIGNTIITDAQLTATPNWTGAEVIIRKNHFVIDRNIVTNHVGQNLTYQSSSTYSGTKNFGYFIQNHIKTLDGFGEWCFDSENKKLSLFLGLDFPLSSSKLEFSDCDTLFYLNGSNFLSFNNLTLTGASITAIELLNSNDIVVDNCKIIYSGNYAIRSTNSKRLIIQNSTVENTNGNAIQLDYDSKSSIIRNNIIRNTGTKLGLGNNSDGNDIAIKTLASNVLVENNVIDSTGYSAIFFKGDSVIIKQNLIKNSCLVKDDGAGIYTYLDNTENPQYGRKVIKNIVLNSVGSCLGTDSYTTQAQGIYMDGRTENVDILENTVANCSNFGIFLNGSRNINIIRNQYSFIVYLFLE